MSRLNAGFSRVNVTPMFGITMDGYFETRYAEGTLDELELSALAVSCGGTTALLISMDVIRMPREIALNYKAHISEVTGVPTDCIYLHATHIHTVPSFGSNADKPLVQEYAQYVYHKMADVSKRAIEDMKPANLGWAVGKAHNVAFIRRYRTKDGSTKTNP